MSILIKNVITSFHSWNVDTNSMFPKLPFRWNLIHLLADFFLKCSCPSYVGAGFLNWKQKALWARKNIYSFHVHLNDIIEFLISYSSKFSTQRMSCFSDKHLIVFRKINDSLKRAQFKLVYHKAVILFNTQIVEVLEAVYEEFLLLFFWYDFPKFDNTTLYNSRMAWGM